MAPKRNRTSDKNAEDRLGRETALTAIRDVLGALPSLHTLERLLKKSKWDVEAAVGLYFQHQTQLPDTNTSEGELN
jgi:hypothetical protein